MSEQRKKLIKILNGKLAGDGVSRNNTLHFIESYFAQREMNLKNHLNLQIASLRNKVEELEDPWIKVEDGLPEEKGDYWVTFMVDGTRVYSRDHFNGIQWLSTISNEFTHYQPITEPKNG